MNSVRTVSDTKRAFYNFHTRPVNSIYRRVVEELMVEMHLLAVNVDFRYDPIYALGVVTTFDCFMQGYRPEQDKESIFNALCQALEDNPQRYRDDSQKILSLASRFSWDALLIPAKSAAIPDVSHLREWTQAIAAQEKFKYSRLFAVGLYTILDTANPDITKDESKRNEAFKEICNALNLSEDKVQKDLELYRSNLEKMSQAQAVIAEALAADRKKREERAQAKSAPETASSETPIDQPSSGS